jgi:hypothetical protein
MMMGSFPPGLSVRRFRRSIIMRDRHPAMRRDSGYRSGSSRDWIKIKNMAIGDRC